MKRNRQVVVIDKVKEASLQKRISQLKNVQLILLAEDTVEIFGFLKEAIPNWQQLPMLRLNETENIISFFEKQLEQCVPLLNGLVLAGGKSVRMGYDKSSIQWHGKEQRYYMADLLKQICKDVFISCRKKQKDEIDINIKHWQTLLPAWDLTAEYFQHFVKTRMLHGLLRHVIFLCSILTRCNI